MAASCALVAASGGGLPTATAQEYEEIPALEGDAFAAGAPGMEMGGGSYFSQELGTLLRLRYNTESYGQDRRGNLDIGTMRVANFEDAIAFFDGQATLNDVNGVGYNLGVGFRWLGWNPFPLEPERITGFSVWADGTSTESGNFFPQVGLSYESLGDMWDLRVNGYIPVGKESQLGEFRPTGAISFDQNFLVQEALADRNTSLNVAEAEIARRIMADRDAWAFAGPYALVNDEQDAAGYRVGMRGYAYPDLLVQVAVTDDDIFKTNAAVSVTWFVGRTRSDYRPACGLPDRMREPVMRNDYVALIKTQEVGGDPLTNTAGDPFRFVHVNSAAAAGGNGTFENPLNDVGEVFPNSQDDDIILLYSNSLFQSQNTMVLQNGQRALGEGNGEFFTINTLQQGLVVIPETSPGARDEDRAIILGAVGDGAVQLADLNEVANFNIDGTGSGANVDGIFSPMDGAGDPNIHDMNFSNVTGTGIQFTPLTRVNETNPALMTIAGSVTIDDVNFDDMGGVEIDLNLATTTPFPDPNVTLNETISITDVDSQNGSDIGIWLRNTHAQRTATITNYTNGTSGTVGSGGGDAATGVLRFEGDAIDDFDGNVLLTNIDIFENDGYAIDYLNQSSTSTTTVAATNGITWNGGGGLAGGMRFDNFNGSFGGNTSTFSNGTLDGLLVTGTSAGTINLAATVTFDSIDGTTINVGPDVTDTFTGDLTVAGNITNHDTGRLVSIQRVTGADATVTLNGDMTDVVNGGSQGILVANNTDGVILFGGDLLLDTTAVNAITLTNNTGADISFAGELDVTTDGVGATGFQASGGGTLTVSATTNTIETNGSTGVDIQGMTISAGSVLFESVNVDTAVNGMVFRDNTGDSIRIGTLADPVGGGGTIQGTSDTAVVIDNSANVTLNSMIIDSPGQTGIEVTKETTGTQTVNLNDLRIGDDTAGTAGSTVAIDVIGDGGATDTLTMTINDVDIQDATVRGIRVSNVDVGAIAVTNTTIDGDDTTAGAEGVEIIGSNATITFDANTTIAEFDGTDFHVTDGNPNITFNGDITNTTGRSVIVEDIDGGTVNFTAPSSITDTGAGMLIEDNGVGTISFLGDNEFDTTTNTAVTLTNNDQGGNATINFASLDITTTGTGGGFVATAGGTVSITGTSNTISTVDGIGLQLSDMNVTAVDFASVNVSGAGGGPVNAILLQNLTGGQVEIGTATGADASGGTVTSTGSAIVISNAANVLLHDMVVADASGAGADAVEITKNNAGTSTVALDNVDVTNAGNDGVSMTTANAGSLTVTATDSDFATVGQHGFNITAGGTGGVTLTATDTTVTTAGQDGISMNVTGSGAVNVSVTTTTFTNLGGQAVDLAANTNANVVNTIISGMTTSDGITISGEDNADLNFRISSSTITGANVVASTIDSAALDYRFTNSTITGSTTMNINGSGNFDMLVENASITTTGTATGITLAFGTNSQDADVIIRNNTTFDANDGAALLVTATGTNAEIDFELSGNDMSNSNAQETVDIEVEGGALLNATIVNNDIANSGGDELYLLSDGSSTQVNLNLDNNDAGGGGMYHLETLNQGVPTMDFNFGIVDLPNVQANNDGTIFFDPAMNQFDDIGEDDVPLPVLP